MFIWELLSKENMVKMIITGLPTLIIAVIVPFISIRFALRQFYSQKWWETKSNSYSKIVEHLSNYGYASGQLFEHYASTEIHNNEIIRKYRELISKSYEEINKQRAAGAFIISSEAVDSLNKFIKNVENNPKILERDWQGEIDTNHGYAIECIEAIKVIAKVDLKVK